MGGAETYVKDHFPDSNISMTYLGISDYILRADLIRYLALLKDGGVYNDVDDNASVVLGIEADYERKEDRSKLFEFVNWTIMARRNAPFMRLLPKRQEVLDVTGPGALTKAAFDCLSKMTATTVTMNNFTKMRKPKLVADILLLPINAFGAGHPVKWSGIDADGSPLVHHYFAGSWKTNHINGPTEEEKKADQGRKELEAKKKAEEQKRKAVGQRRIKPGRSKPEAREQYEDTSAKHKPGTG
ncbi:MAG: hypothetical protein Q9224_007600 [Gallowayella concinna]